MKLNIKIIIIKLLLQEVIAITECTLAGKPEKDHKDMMLKKSKCWLD